MWTLCPKRLKKWNPMSQNLDIERVSREGFRKQHTFWREGRQKHALSWAAFLPKGSIICDLGGPEGKLSQGPFFRVSGPRVEEMKHFSTRGSWKWCIFGRKRSKTQKKDLGLLNPKPLTSYPRHPKSDLNSDEIFPKRWNDIIRSLEFGLRRT